MGQAMILLSIAALAGLLGLVVFFDLPLCRSGMVQSSHPNLSIIVPARNEERNLPRLLESLQGQEPTPHEILVVDDGSEDATAEIARRAGAGVIVPGPAPAGWRGKSWACWQGAHAATGDLLLFIDADTFFYPGGLRRILDTYAETGGVMSVGAYHQIERAYENLSAFFNLVMTVGVSAFTLLGRRLTPRGMFGPFLMLDRATYFAHGGHERVREEVLEVFCMAENFRASGVPIRCYGGKDSFGMRMYPDGLKSLIDGWTKSFAYGAVRAPLAIVLITVVWLGGATLAWLGALCSGLFGGDESNQVVLWLILYALFAVQIYVFLKRIGSFGEWAALFYFIPLVFYFVVFARASALSFMGRKVLWKGRNVNPNATVK